MSVLVRRNVEEKKVSNLESPVFSNHGDARNSQHCAPLKPKSSQKIQSTAPNSNKQKPSPQGGVSLQRKASVSSSGQQNSPPVRAASLPGQPTPADSPDPASAARPRNALKTTLQGNRKMGNNQQPGKPLGTLSQNIARSSPTDARMLKKSEQRNKLLSPAEQQVICGASRVGESTGILIGAAVWLQVLLQVALNNKKHSKYDKTDFDLLVFFFFYILHSQEKILFDHKYEQNMCSDKFVRNEKCFGSYAGGHIGIICIIVTVIVLWWSLCENLRSVEVFFYVIVC